MKHAAVAVQNKAQPEANGRRTWQRLLRWFERLGVVAVPYTQAIVASLQPLPPRLHLGPVIPNGCDTSAMRARASALQAQRPSDDARRVVTVARLVPIKDQTILLRAFAAARQPGWQLQLIGDGIERSRLEALAAELGLNPAEVVLGRSSHIPDLLGQADLFAFSTTAAEGFGIALIEALAAGLPVIASDVPACREVLEQGSAGDLLPPGDVEAWSQRLEQLMLSANARRTLTRQARSHADHHDIRDTAMRWYQLLGV